MSITDSTFGDQTAVQGHGVQHDTWNTRSTDPRLIAGVLAVVVGVVVAVLGSIALSTVWSTLAAVTAAAGGGLVVAAAVCLTMFRALRRRRLAAARARRACVLGSLAAPEDLGVEQWAARRDAARADPLRVLLAPKRALIGLQARRHHLDGLRAWCTDLDAAALQVLSFTGEKSVH